MNHSMDGLSPAERVYSAGRPDAVAYRALIVESTASRHGSGVEDALRVVITKYRQLNAAYVAYLAGGGRPGGQARSSKWREADHAYNGALETLAAMLGHMYRKGDGTPPITEVGALVEHRVGPLCTGWPQGNKTVHAPGDICPQHQETR